MLLLSVKKTITKDNAFSQERCQISSPHQSSVPELQAGLSPEALFATWPAQPEPWGVKRVWIFLDSSPTSREKKRECTQAFSRCPPLQRVEEMAESLSESTSLRSHRMFGCHPCNQESLEQGTEFIQTPLASTDGHPAFSGLSQALNRPCWNSWAWWISSCINSPPRSSSASAESYPVRRWTPGKIYPSQATRSSAAPDSEFIQKGMSARYLLRGTW